MTIRAKKETASLDLASLDTNKACNEPYKLELKHPVTKAPLGAYILILGKESDVFREYTDEKFNNDVRINALNSKLGLERDPLTIEQQRKNGTEILVACTVDFENLNYQGGSYEYSVTNAFKLYSEQRWIREQVDAAIVNIGNFMQS